MRHIAILLLASSLFLLTSCANNSQGNGQTKAAGDSAKGAKADQTIGHNTEATLTGMTAKTLIGYIVGTEMDKYDRQELNHVYERGVSGSSTSWINPDTGNRFSVTPEPAYSHPQYDQPCRKAEIKAIINSQEETTYTTACRTAKGQWKLK